jgi:outer membrane protein assembly factor BamB
MICQRNANQRRKLWQLVCRPSAMLTIAVFRRSITSTGVRAVLTLSALCCGSSHLAADDWPGWRGPRHDGIARGPQAPTRWTETENVFWRTRLPGRGHASPIVIGNRVFLPVAYDAEQIQAVIAIDRDRGKLLWQTDLQTGNFETAVHAENSHASSTLAWDGQRLFASFLNGGRIWCHALDPNGEELWQTNVGAFRSRFGYSASPMVFGPVVLIAADHEDGGFLAALNRESGAIVWRRKRPAFASYATPRVVTLGGKALVVLAGANQITAYDPQTGTEAWSTPGTTESVVGTVVASADLVVASGGYPGAETIALRPDGTVSWRLKEKTYVPSLLLLGESLITVQDNGVARCWNAENGEPVWQQRVGGKFRASPVALGQTVYATDMAGRTVVFSVKQRQYALLAENQLGTDGFASPAIVDGQIYLRTADRSSGRWVETLYSIGEPVFTDLTEEPAKP